MRDRVNEVGAIYEFKLMVRDSFFLQENSLYIINKAVDFVNEQSVRNVSNIDYTTKNLIQGAALILSSASKDKNEKVNTNSVPLNMFKKKL